MLQSAAVCTDGMREGQQRGTGEYAQKLEVGENIQ